MSRAAWILSFAWVVWLHGCTSDSKPDQAAAGSGGGMVGAGDAAPGGGGEGCTENLACKLSAPASTGDVRQDCVNRINQFRTECACLPPLERWTAGEACADQMAMHDGATGKAHAGFSGRICTPGGNGQNECPSYPSEQVVLRTCLQQMWNEGPPPRATCEGSCFLQHGHFINMTNPRFERVACGFHRTASGSVWSVQNFSP